jgi:hypothetical protein
VVRKILFENIEMGVKTMAKRRERNWLHSENSGQLGIYRKGAMGELLRGDMKGRRDALTKLYCVRQLTSPVLYCTVSSLKDRPFFA